MRQIKGRFARQLAIKEAAKGRLGLGEPPVGVLDYVAALQAMARDCHLAATAAGWWVEDRNFGELIALIHSELSEALEAGRKDLVSDHLSDFSGVEEELADVLIRVFDLAGALGIRLGAAFLAKLEYNRTREDHKLENRAKAGGKAF